MTTILTIIGLVALAGLCAWLFMRGMDEILDEIDDTEAQG